MVFFSRKKKSDSQQLLDHPKGLFARRRDAEKSSESDKGQAGTKRLVRLFARTEDNRHPFGTPPPTPTTPLNITVVTLPPSPPRIKSVKDDEDLSELTASVKKYSDTPSLYSSSLINNDIELLAVSEPQPTVNSNDYDSTDVEATAGESTSEASKPVTTTCATETTSDVVTKILGMMDEACTSSDRRKKRDDANGSTVDPLDSASSAASRRSDLASAMSSVFSGVITRPSTTAGESSSSASSGLPTWGIAPSHTEDEDAQPTADTRELVEEILQKSRGVDAAPSTRDAPAATIRNANSPKAPSTPAVPKKVADASQDDDKNPDEHEDIELVLGREINNEPSIKRRSWLHRGREPQEEKKEEDPAAKSARYRAVFGADPDDTPKKNILPAFVKRLSMAGTRRESRVPEIKVLPIETRLQLPPPEIGEPYLSTRSLDRNSSSKSDGPSLSTRSLRPGGLETEESLRGVHYLEDDPDPEQEEEIKVEPVRPRQPAVVTPEVEKVDDEPVMLNESKRSRSWNQTLQLMLGGANEEPINEVESPVPTVPRTRSSPMRLLGFGGPLKPPKPTWKSTVDHTTGVPYYYHRLTRQTTWTKPKEFDKQHDQWDNYQQQKKHAAKPKQQNAADIATKKTESPSGQTRDLSAENQKRIEDGLPIVDNVEATSILRKKSPRDFNPDVWSSKEKIVRLLTMMSPPNAESVERLMKQYEGREEELLGALEDLVESQPFDEPMQTESSLASSEMIDEPIGAVADVMSDEGYNRIRTEVTATSGFLSQKTEKTEKHRNTAAVDSPLPGHALSNSASFSSKSLSLLDTSREEPSPNKKNVIIDYKVKPSTVPRNRELVVEDFTNTRLKKENYDMGSRASLKKIAPVQPSRDETESSYNGDNDETDEEEEETFGGDSISALSEVDGDFQRREQIELVRQRLVDEANETRQAEKPREWKQSELDKFISENGWDAVASYVSRMQSSKDAPTSAERFKVREDAPRPNGRRPEAPKTAPPKSAQPVRAPVANEQQRPSGRIQQPPFAQRKFGARSQLQHSALGDDSSWDSESSYESDEYTTTSYESDEDPSLLAAKLHRKEFVC